jgi:hypothetical protein
VRKGTETMDKYTTGKHNSRVHTRTLMSHTRDELLGGCLLFVLLFQQKHTSVNMYLLYNP